VFVDATVAHPGGRALAKRLTSDHGRGAEHAIPPRIAAGDSPMKTLPLKPFDEMTAEDYAAIGFKSGLEVHQQLKTRTKLFCRCPAGQYSSDFDAQILRHMRPTLSEMGEYDGTALMEKKTRKNIHYRIHHDTVCTYEFDDTPPFLVDPEAVDIALEISMLCRLSIVNELHIARKQYLDGSIPTGFQRTTILGVDGWLQYGDRRIGVRQLSLEEDSCREVSDRGHDRVYLTDRLGMPLIEVVTEPEMYTPFQVAEVCEIIGRMCRSTQHVRRGYGATRQDVNVSVEGGTRVEIKGVPQIWRIPRLTYNEASRQVALLNIREKLRSRGVTTDSFEWLSEDVTDLLTKTSYQPIAAAMSEGLRVTCLNLRGFGGLLSETTQEHTIFAKEFSDRVRVIACLSRLPNIVHSDNASETMLAQDWQKLRQRMQAGEQDALIVVWGDEADTRTAVEEIVIRGREATIGIPSDTRQPLKDGTTGFERVLPGAERMYPDTDLPPIEITSDRLDRLREGLPEYIWDTEARFRDAGMAAEDIRELAISPRAPLVRRLIEELDLPGMQVGMVLSQRFKALRRAGLDPIRLGDDAIEAVFRAYLDGRLAREGVVWLMTVLLREERTATIAAQDVVETLDELEIKPLGDDELDARIARALARVEERDFGSRGKMHRYLTGHLMHGLIGRVGGERLVKVLNEKLQLVSTEKD
jgi:glutamyl-tRNA(Gln) amidotransferase subunit E